MDQHYLKHVTSLGETQDIHASEDIKNSQGIKLIAKGIRIDQRFLDLLLQHKLNNPIDSCLEITGVLSASKLKRCAISAFGSFTDLRMLFGHLSDFTDLAGYINCLLLNQTLLNKLSVMQYRLPKQFEHSLRVAIICLFIGRICQVSEPEMQQLAMIGLLHDIGVLHINPVLLEEERELDASEWRQMYAHPIIGFLILQRQAGLPTCIARAVMEHHERIDGSGYPKHLKDSQISKLGHIVAIAEVIMGICQKNSCEHFITIFKTNMEKVDKNISEKICYALYTSKLIVHPELSQTIVTQASAEELSVVIKMAETVSRIFSSWQEASAKLDEKDSKRLNSRIMATFQGMNKAGISPLDAVNSIKLYDQDLLALNESKYLLIETLYQLRNILRLEIQANTDENSLSAQLKAWFSFAEQQLSAIDSLLN